MAFVVLDGDDEHGLALISETVTFASGPVLVTVRQAESAATIARAADMGIAGYVDSWAPADVQGAIDVAPPPLPRGGAAPREGGAAGVGARAAAAVIERAKGVLMERHGAGRARAVRAAPRPRALGRPARRATSRRPSSTAHALLAALSASSPTSASTSGDGPATCQRVPWLDDARLAARPR